MPFKKFNAKRVSTGQDEPLKKVMKHLNFLVWTYKQLIRLEKEDNQEQWTYTKTVYDSTLANFYTILGEFLAGPVPAAPSRPYISDSVRLAIGNLSRALSDPKTGIRSEIGGLCQALDGVSVEEAVQVTETKVDEDVGKFTHTSRRKLAEKKYADMSCAESVVSSSSSSSEEHSELDDAAYALKQVLLEMMVSATGREDAVSVEEFEGRFQESKPTSPCRQQ